MNSLHTQPAYTRAQDLPATLAQRLVILDGAMGTMIQRFKLGEAQYRGEGYGGADGAGNRFQDFAYDVKGNNELLSITRPDVIRDIHEKYLAAGADLNCPRFVEEPCMRISQGRHPVVEQVLTTPFVANDLGLVYH